MSPTTQLSDDCNGSIHAESLLPLILFPIIWAYFQGASEEEKVALSCKDMLVPMFYLDTQ